MLYYLCVYVTYMRRGYRVDVFHCRVRGLYIETGSEQNATICRRNRA